MRFLDRFSVRFKNFGIPNLMGYVTSTMLVAFIAERFLGLPVTQTFGFYWPAILSGEVWRLVTFVILPPSSSIFWLIISLLSYYYIGSQLEAKWGTPLFSLYYLVGVVGAIIAGILSGFTTNNYLNLSLLLGFAILYPDLQFTIYLVLPIKAKYLAAAYGVILLLDVFKIVTSGRWNQLLALIMSLINVLVFFGPTFWDGGTRALKNYKRRKKFESETRSSWKD